MAAVCEIKLVRGEGSVLGLGFVQTSLASYIALTETYCFVLSRASIVALFEKSPTFEEHVWRLDASQGACGQLMEVRPFNAWDCLEVAAHCCSGYLYTVRSTESLTFEPSTAAFLLVHGASQNKEYVWSGVPFVLPRDLRIATSWDIGSKIFVVPLALDENNGYHIHSTVERVGLSPNPSPRAGAGHDVVDADEEMTLFRSSKPEASLSTAALALRLLASPTALRKARHAPRLSSKGDSLLMRMLGRLRVILSYERLPTLDGGVVFGHQALEEEDDTDLSITTSAAEGDDVSYNGLFRKGSVQKTAGVRMLSDD